MNEQMTFEEFRLDWLLRHPASIVEEEAVSIRGAVFWIAFWLLVCVAASVYSASHTIPAATMTIYADVIGRVQIGVTAFILVELVVFGAAVGRHDIHWLKWLMWGALVVGEFGIVGASIHAVILNGGNVLNLIGGALLAAMTPLTGFAAGEVVYIEMAKLRAKRRKAREALTTNKREVDAKINTAWTVYKQRAAPLLSVETDVNLRKFTSNSRPTPKMKRALLWLRDHPEHLDTESRELGNLIGVSHTLANVARNQIKHEQAVEPNGNGHHA